MEESIITDELFRRAFAISMIVGISCRAFVLRRTNKQYPSRPQDYLEQIIISGLSASLGAVALPALIDKEFAALTFFAVAIQQYQGLAKQERITIENIDKAEIVPKGAGYIEEISATYEARSYISLFSALAASIGFLTMEVVLGVGFILSTTVACISGGIIALIFRRALRRDSIGDIADVVPARISFDEANLMVNNIYIANIGLEETRKRYLKDALAVQIKPRDLGKFGVVNDSGQRNAILHNVYINLGIDKDVDEEDILAMTRTDLNSKTVVFPYIPILKDMDEMIRVIKSTPVIETAKGKQSANKTK